MLNTITTWLLHFIHYVLSWHNCWHIPGYYYLKLLIIRHWKMIKGMKTRRTVRDREDVCVDEWKTIKINYVTPQINIMILYNWSSNCYVPDPHIHLSIHLPVYLYIHPYVHESIWTSWHGAYMIHSSFSAPWNRHTRCECGPDPRGTPATSRPHPPTSPAQTTPVLSSQFFWICSHV